MCLRITGVEFNRSFEVPASRLEACEAPLREVGAALDVLRVGIDVVRRRRCKAKFVIRRQGSAQRVAASYDNILFMQKSFNCLEECRVPVLVAIQGGAFGGGVDLSVACDMRYATASTRFAVKEVDLAIVADLGSLQRLPRIVGEVRVA